VGHGTVELVDEKNRRTLKREEKGARAAINKKANCWEQSGKKKGVLTRPQNLVLCASGGKTAHQRHSF